MAETFQGSEEDEIRVILAEEEWFWMFIGGFVGLESSRQRRSSLALFCDERKIPLLRQFLEKFVAIYKIQVAIKVVENVAAIDHAGFFSAGQTVVLSSVFGVWSQLISQSFVFFSFLFSSKAMNERKRK